MLPSGAIPRSSLSSHLRRLVRPALIVSILLSAYFLLRGPLDAGLVGALKWREGSNTSQQDVGSWETSARPTPSHDAAAETMPTPFEVVSIRPQSPPPGDRIIVMGSLEREDTSWVQEHLPDWQNAIYVVDNTSAPLHTPRNKGREANAYLLYIIQNYHALPSTVVFLHPHRDGWPGGWHTDVAGYDNVLAMNSLNIDFVQKEGYVNLRCNWVPGCPDEVQYLRSVDDFDPENMEHQMPEAWLSLFGSSNAVPEVIATPCCAQFAVSREQIRKRPLADYERYHQWLMETPKSDHLVGLIFEYLWHIIFGRDAVHCPETMQCYRDVYGD